VLHVRVGAAAARRGVARLGFIRGAQAAGLTLGEVSGILALRGAW
jgi:hypothetical protein